MGLKIDRHLVDQLISDFPQLTEKFSQPIRGISVTQIEPEILDAFRRLLDLLEKPEDIPAVAPMILREIHYRLLTGPRKDYVLAASMAGSNVNRIADAVKWLKQNYRNTIQIDDLAKKFHMASSTFYRHFKAVTTLSPLQYQKRLRLYEAHQLMLVENEYAYAACQAVGYESATQFNREYKRLFGQSPSKNIHAR